MINKNLSTNNSCHGCHNSETEHFAILAQKGGGPAAEEFLQMPEQLTSVAVTMFRALEAFPDNFLTPDVSDFIVDRLGVEDHARLLWILTLGGYIAPGVNDKRVAHIKPQRVRVLSDESLAADIVVKVSRMLESEKLRGYVRFPVSQWRALH